MSASQFQTSLNLTVKQSPVLQPALTESVRADFVTSSRTSIFRAGPSAPVKVILEKGLLCPGSAINYGKGVHNFDTDAIAKITGHAVGYDYVHLPDLDVLGSSYKFLFSGYVVNTLPKVARQFVWCQMSDCTALDGIAFVAARTDKANIKGTPSEDGFISSIKTFQKAYAKGALCEEALVHFEHVVEIKGKSGFSLVACSHSPLPDRILKHAK